MNRHRRTVPAACQAPARWRRAVRSLTLALGLAVAAALAGPAWGASRIKDIVDFEGVRDNLLVGYGLVVGLDGTGDTLRNAAFTEESPVAMLERLGVAASGTALRTRNVAAVMVTATLPPFARQGSRIDARWIAQAINAYLSAPAADTRDWATVVVRPPLTYRGRTVALLSEIEQLRVEPDEPARVLIDESAGIVVIGENVRISTVAVAQGNLTVRITEAPQVLQPQPFAEGETVVVPRTHIEIEEDRGRRMVVLPDGVTLGDLVDGLNSLGVGPRDLIGILQAIKAAGALQAEIEVM